MENESYDARSALEAAQATEVRSAQIATSTPWYAPWYGITCSLVPAAIGFLAASQVGLGLVLITLECVSLALLVTTYQRITGVWPSARGGMAHFVAAIAVMLGAGVLNCVLGVAYGVSWWILVVAAVTAVGMALLSRSYDAALVRKNGDR